MSMSAVGEKGYSISRVPTIGSKITPNMSTRLNAYSNLNSAMAGNSRMSDISMSMKNTTNVSTNQLGTSLRQNTFKLGMGPLSKGRTAAKTTNLAMSASFNISGTASNNQIIENYQDMSVSGVSRKPSRGNGWTSGSHINAFSRNHGKSSRVVMKATPEGSWGDVSRKPVVGGNWKSNGDMDFVNSFPKDVLNKSEFDEKKMQVCVAPTDIHLVSVNSITKDQINVMAQDVSQYPKGAYTGNITAD